VVTGGPAPPFLRSIADLQAYPFDAVQHRGVAGLRRRASNGTNKMTAVLKRSIVVAGHKTSISLEDEFWNSLREIASARAVALSRLVASIDQNRQHGNLSSCIRLFVLEYYQARSDASISGQDNIAELKATVEPAGFTQTSLAGDAR
jgi:predicted DNA-binding ribbon-helix-helix protein